MESKKVNGRTLHKGECSNCNKIIWKRKDYFKTYNNVFCGSKCRKQHRMTGKFVNCNNCDKQIYRTVSEIEKSKSGFHYCSKRCATIKNNSIYKTRENHPSWNGGGSSYRLSALKHYGEQCQNKNCDLSIIDIPVEMLDVHHIDENRSNNELKNLIVLCVYCHAKLTRRLNTLTEDKYFV